MYIIVWLLTVTTLFVGLQNQKYKYETLQLNLRGKGFEYKPFNNTMYYPRDNLITPIETITPNNLITSNKLITPRETITSNKCYVNEYNLNLITPNKCYVNNNSRTITSSLVVIYESKNYNKLSLYHLYIMSLIISVFYNMMFRVVLV